MFLRCGIFILLFCTAAGAADAPRGPFAKRLAEECDALIHDAIRRPYGWGWTQDAAAEPAGKPTPRAVSMEPLGTPAAGLVLLLAEEELHDSRYGKAARQVARAVAICQKSIGRLSGNPVFSRTPLFDDERAVIADRSATRCGLGLMLALLEESPSTATTGDDTARRSAARASDWLCKQLAASNYWPTAYPPDAPPLSTQRIVRFDDTDYRDCTIALLLSAQLLENAQLNHIAPTPIAALLKVILKGDVHGPNLWNTAITIDAIGVPKDFPRGPDVLASRYVMQTLLAGYLLTGEHADGIALDAAATTLRQSRRADGLYDRFLDPTTAADLARGHTSPTTAQSFFAHPTTQRINDQPISAPFTTGTFGVPALIDAIGRLKVVGRDRYLAMIGTTFSLHEQLEATLCGLIDDPMTMTLPGSADEVSAWTAANGDEFKKLDSPEPNDLAGRVQRIWLLLERAKVERMFPEASIFTQ